MATCSRCGSRWPNSSCFVCAEPDPPSDWLDHDDQCPCHECKADRDACRGDYLRDEMIDRQMEAQQETKTP